MKFGLLGPLEVRADDGPVPLGPPQQRALLAMLLLDANRAVARERLIEGLWGEDPPETAVKSVQVYVSRLRKLLPEGILLTQSPGYLLAVEPETLDLTRFERLASQARSSAPQQAARLWRDALALWRGPALAEFGDEPFARVEAARLEELRLTALENQIDADLALGRHAELIGELEGLVAGEPHRERLRGQLMLALYRCGRQTEALASYRNARAALGELGLEPGRPLRQLEKQILTQDATLELAPGGGLAEGHAPLPGQLVPESQFPFVGRDRELATLRGLLATIARTGQGAFALVSGEPGSGKTRLLREFAHDAVATGAVVCYGASDATVRVPYGPVREWLEFLSRVVDPATLLGSAGPGPAVLSRLAPELATFPDAPRPLAGDDGPTDRYLLQSAVCEFLLQTGAIRPLVLVAEDIHWADTETLLLLGRLARRAPESRLLVIASFRQPGEALEREVVDALADLSRLDSVNRIALGTLEDDDLLAFVRASTHGDASAGLLTAMRELTDGMPLLVCELWRDLVAGGALQTVDAQVRLLRPAGELRGPERVRELVAQRLTRLSKATREVVELAAAAGPRFELEVLRAAARLDDDELAETVELATRSGIIEELPESTPTGRFTHELVRRAIYDRIPRVRLPGLHLRVGDALEQVTSQESGQALSELARHFALAAPLVGADKAIAYNARAAEAAVSSVAFGEAAELFSTALRLGVADPRERARIQVELGQALYETGRIAEAEALLATARDAAADVAERELTEHALVRLATARMNADPAVGAAELIPVAEQAIETFEELGDVLGLAEAEYLLSQALLRAGRRTQGFAVQKRAHAYAQTAGAAGLRREIVLQFADGLCGYGTPVHEVIALLEELLSASRDDRVLEASLLCCRAFALAMAGRLDEARAQLDVSIPALDEAGEAIPIRLRIARRMAGNTRLLLGDYDAAERDLIALHLEFRDLRGDAPEGRALLHAARLALIYCDQGRWQEAAGALVYGEEVDRMPPVYGKVYSFIRLAARARVAAHRGEFSDAVELAQAAVEVAERTDRLNDRALAWLALAEVQSAAGNHAEAEDAVKRALELYERKGNVGAATLVAGRWIAASG
jgi:DNA-binding SARP family transcriptional activator